MMNKNGIKDFVSSFLVSYAVSYATTKMVQSAKKTQQTTETPDARATVKDILKGYNAVRK